jgi:hypothetical protein
VAPDAAVAAAATTAAVPVLLVFLLLPQLFLPGSRNKHSLMAAVLVGMSLALPQLLFRMFLLHPQVAP